jgi:hypothetical protein
MARTVNEAFSQFLSSIVNIDPTQTAAARSSRDWLVDHLHALPEKHSDFPISFSDYDIFYGSFERRTKTRPLDDVDLISCMSAEGASYTESGGTLYITAKDDTRLWKFCDTVTGRLNSRRVLNRFVQGLSDIPQYSKADIGRNGEAAKLSLVSHPWSFDIVPGFFSKPDFLGRTYYVIPDGNGNWKKTDPRIDRDRISAANQRHSGRVLNLVRLIKYWNRRPTMPTMPSYLLECLLLDYFELPYLSVNEFVDLALIAAWDALATSVWLPVQDPARIQGDINALSYQEQNDVSARARVDAARAREALGAETAGDQQKALGIWRDIFGPSFPSYS